MVASFVSPSSPFLGSKISVSARLAHCGDDDPVTGLDRSANPTNVRIYIGSEEENEYYGALVGDILVVVFVWLIAIGLSLVLPSWRPKLIGLAIRIHLWMHSGIITTSVFVMAYMRSSSALGILAMLGIVVSTGYILYKAFHPKKFLADIEPVTPKAFNYSQPILSVLRLLTQKKQRWESHGRFNPKRPWKMSVCEFVETFGGVFSSFREGREWYVLVDAVVVTTLSVMQGLVALPCVQLHVMVVIVQAFDLVCIVLLHPHHTLRDHVLDVVVYIAKLFMVFPLLTPPQHPIRQASEVAGVVVFVLSAYGFVIFFVRMYVSKQDKKEEARANYIGPEADDNAVPLHPFLAQYLAIHGHPEPLGQYDYQYHVEMVPRVGV